MVRYSIIGDDTAPVFFKINTETGDIQLRAQVNPDDKTEYKVTFYINIIHKKFNCRPITVNVLISRSTCIFG